MSDPKLVIHSKAILEAGSKRQIDIQRLAAGQTVEITITLTQTYRLKAGERLPDPVVYTLKFGFTSGPRRKKVYTATVVGGVYNSETNLDAADNVVPTLEEVSFYVLIKKPNGRNLSNAVRVSITPTAGKPDAKIEARIAGAFLTGAGADETFEIKRRGISVRKKFEDFLAWQYQLIYGPPMVAFGQGRRPGYYLKPRWKESEKKFSEAHITLGNQSTLDPDKLSFKANDVTFRWHRTTTITVKKKAAPNATYVLDIAGVKIEHKVGPGQRKPRKIRNALVKNAKEEPKKGELESKGVKRVAKKGAKTIEIIHKPGKKLSVTLTPSDTDLIEQSEVMTPQSIRNGLLEGVSKPLPSGIGEIAKLGNDTIRVTGTKWLKASEKLPFAVAVEPDGSNDIISVTPYSDVGIIPISVRPAIDEPNRPWEPVSVNADVPNERGYGMVCSPLVGVFLAYWFNYGERLKFLAGSKLGTRNSAGNSILKEYNIFLKSMLNSNDKNRWTWPKFMEKLNATSPPSEAPKPGDIYVCGSGYHVWLVVRFGGDFNFDKKYVFGPTAEGADCETGWYQIHASGPGPRIAKKGMTFEPYRIQELDRLLAVLDASPAKVCEELQGPGVPDATYESLAKRIRKQLDSTNSGQVYKIFNSTPLWWMNGKINVVGDEVTSDRGENYPGHSIKSKMGTDTFEAFQIPRGCLKPESGKVVKCAKTVFPRSHQHLLTGECWPLYLRHSGSSP